MEKEYLQVSQHAFAVLFAALHPQTTYESNILASTIGHGRGRIVLLGLDITIDPEKMNDGGYAFFRGGLNV